MKKDLLKKYLVLCFGISWPVMIILALNAERIGVSGFRTGLVFVMFIPTLAALLSGADIRVLGWKPNLRKNGSQ